MSSRLGAFAVLAALSAAPASAHALEVVSVLPIPAMELAAGAQTHISIHLMVKPGYHVQANPVENPSLIPITLRIDPVESIFVGAPVYPRAKRLRLAGDDQDLVVYDGAFVIVLPVNAAPGAAGASFTLKGSLRYQACDDRHCLFPVTLPVAIAVTVAAR
jgi:thiol:disulfide interchange protein DsbD